MLAVAVPVLINGMTGRTAADLNGDTIAAVHLFPDMSTVSVDLGMSSVTPTAQFTDPSTNSLIHLDVTGTTITIINTSSSFVDYSQAAFNGYRITDVTSDPGISGVTIDSSSSVPGLDPSRITFSCDQGRVSRS
jgi:hypothetical protein